MLCTRLPSQTEFCYREEVRFSMAAVGGGDRTNDTAGRLKQSRVSKVQVSCGLPSISTAESSAS
jgi:hypothetical protein